MSASEKKKGARPEGYAHVWIEDRDEDGTPSWTLVVRTETKRFVLAGAPTPHQFKDEATFVQVTRPVAQFPEMVIPTRRPIGKSVRGRRP